MNLVHKIDSAGIPKVPNLLSTQVGHADAGAGNGTHAITPTQVGQRVANGFAKYNRIFLAGDAVNTHSPKAGRGMNVSMHDSYNLVWKIASVINKKSHPLILSTYATQRRSVALQLIEFDRQFSRMFSGRLAKDIADEAGISMEDLKRTFEKGNIFTSGICVKMKTMRSLIARETLRFHVTCRFVVSSLA